MESRGGVVEEGGGAGQGPKIGAYGKTPGGGRRASPTLVWGCLNPKPAIPLPQCFGDVGSYFTRVGAQVNADEEPRSYQKLVSDTV